MAVLAEAAPIVEPVSLDEAFLEPPALAGATPAEVEEFGTTLRAAVRTRTGLPASVGAGSGKQLAKIASELAKPDGLRVVAPDEEHEVLGPLPVRALWGVGPVAEAALHRLGVRTIGALAALDLREATDVLGVAIGTELHRLARGIDERPVAPRGAAKQISAETTFDVDLTTMTAVHDAVTRITGGAHRRLVESGRAARTVTVKIRSADFTTHTRSETATLATTDLGTLTAVAQRLARAAVGEGGVRLIGVSLAGLGDEPPPGCSATPGRPTTWPALRRPTETGRSRRTTRRAARPTTGTQRSGRTTARGRRRTTAPADGRAAAPAPAREERPPARRRATGNPHELAGRRRRHARRVRARVGPGRRARARHRAVRDPQHRPRPRPHTRRGRPGAAPRRPTREPRLRPARAVIAVSGRLTAYCRQPDASTRRSPPRPAITRRRRRTKGRATPPAARAAAAASAGRSGRTDPRAPRPAGRSATPPRPPARSRPGSRSWPGRRAPGRPAPAP